MNYSPAMVSKYFPTFYSNGTQKRLAQHSQDFQDLVHQLFGKYCIEIERERYRRGKRLQLPCDLVDQQNEFSKTDEKIISILTKFNALTTKQIRNHLNESAKVVHSKLYHAVKRGDIIKLMPPPSSKIKYKVDKKVTMFALAYKFKKQNDL
jgi:predicted HTH transcriptional regulator